MGRNEKGKSAQTTPTSVKEIMNSELPEEVKIALEVMGRVMRVRRTVPVRRFPKQQYYRIA